MGNRIGIRLEDKNLWERRVPLTPADVSDLTAQNIDISVERSPKRVFEDAQYTNAKASLKDDVDDCDLILGVKEMPKGYFKPGKAYMFFSHTIKGQPYNMKMLAELVEKKCTLLDYEIVTNDKGLRLIFFGRFAGIAGMTDTLWTMGKRLKALGLETPFAEIEPAHRYANLEQIREKISAVGKKIAAKGLPKELSPLVVGITGYGNVSKGAQEILDLLPHVEVPAPDLAGFVSENKGLTDKIAKVIYREEDIVQPNDESKPFVLQEYYDHPERFHSIFEPHLGLLSVLVNGIFWNEKYPKLADANQLKKLFAAGNNPRLFAVGDVTCDVDGSLACTVRDTEPGDPVYVYDPQTRNATSGFEGKGLAVMAVGNLPAELPRDASSSFSAALKPFIPELAAVDFNVDFDEAKLSGPMKRSVILWRGRFTPNYQYMQDFLRKPSQKDK